MREAEARADEAVPDRAASRLLAPLQVLALQRMAGNQAVAELVGSTRGTVPVQRGDGPAAASPAAPTSSQAPGTVDVIHFEGKALRFDRSVLVKVLSKIEIEQGLDARSSFIGRFRTAPLGAIPFTGNERPGLYDDIKRGLDDARTQLDHEHEEFTKKFEETANDAARGILNESEQKLRAESARLGLRMTGATANIPGETSATFYEMGNKAAGAQLRAAANELIPFAKEADKAGRESAVALDKFNKASETDPFGLFTKPLYVEWEARRKRWQEAEEAYEKEKRKRVATQPSLAIYAEQPKAADKLAQLATMSDGQLGNAMADEINGRLENIAKVRPEIGKEFKVWSQPHLRRVTLDQMNATPLQREVVDRKTRAVKAGESDKMLFSLLAIGLGLIAAIPSGGSSLMVGISAAAAVAGAGLSMYQLGQEMSQFSLAASANATDFDKAKAISHNDPDSMGLALMVVGAIGDVFGAAQAFKALSGVFKAAKAGDVKAALNIVRTVDDVGIKGASKQKIVGEAVAGLTDKAVEEVGKTMAKSGGAMTQGEYIAKMIAGLGEHAAFKAELQKATQLLDHVIGRIPDTARQMIREGKVRVFSEASLIDVYGVEKGRAKWAKLSYADGFYDGKTIFLRTGQTPEELAGALIHEATHKIGDANPLRGNDFLSEAIAEFAERDFYMTLYAEGGPLAGRPVQSDRIRKFLTWSDEQLMANIESRYFAAKAGMDPAKRVKFKNLANLTPEQVTKEIFDDIAADYQAKLPKG